MAAIVVRYRTIPNHNTAQKRFDIIIVLGTPSLPDGKPSPEQRERVLEGIREYRAGVAPRLIMTGAAAHNGFYEAHTMALFAESQGVPASDILEERRALNTIQNIFYSRILMLHHGWQSAEVVSSPSHLPRAALILAHYHFPWRTDAAHWPPEYNDERKSILYSAEAAYCAKLSLLGFHDPHYLP